MAGFVAEALSKIASLNPPEAHATKPSPGLWMYVSTTDALATVVAAGYFNDVRDIFLGPDDDTNWILAIATDGFRMLSVVVDPDPTGDVTVTAVIGAVS